VALPILVGVAAEHIKQVQVLYKAGVESLLLDIYHQHSVERAATLLLPVADTIITCLPAREHLLHNSRI
jgi:hypothetical protein